MRAPPGADCDTLRRMRNAPLGPALLVVLGLPLLAGGIGGAALRRMLAEQNSGPIGWIYVVATGTVAAAFAVWLILRWRRWRTPCAAPDGPVRERAWFAASVIAGVGIGVFAGALNKVGNPHWAAVLSYFLFLPAVYLAQTLGARLGRALLRVVVVTLAVEIGAQTGASLIRQGEFKYWDDITGIDAALGGSAVVVALVASRWRQPIAAWLARRRPAPPGQPDPDTVPRRA